MRVPVNLASEPFRHDRPLIIASAAVGVLLAFSFVVLVWLAIAERDRAAEARNNMAQASQQLEALNREQARLESILRQPLNAEVLDKVQFVNALLLRKGVSWTKIFGDLESVVPHNVRLMSVRPQIDAGNELLLDMWVGAQSSEPVLQLLMALEASEKFGTTTMHNWLPPTQTDPLFRYRLSVRYGQKL